MLTQNSLSGAIGPFPDPVSGQDVNGTAQISYEVDGPGALDPATLAQVDGALLYGLNAVLTAKLASNQAAIPTLQPSLPYYTAEIAETSGIANLGLRLSSFNAVLAIQMPAPAVAPYTGPMPPNPMQATANAFKHVAQERLDPRNYEVKATVNVGGLKIKASSEKGVDTEGIKNQIVDKAKTNLIWWVGGCLVMGVVGLFVLGFAGYIAYVVMDAMPK